MRARGGEGGVRCEGRCEVRARGGVRCERGGESYGR